jgi:hypothetical protein
LGLLLVRAALSQMDVRMRSSFVMAVVTEAERPAAASITSAPRSLAASLSPRSLARFFRCHGQRPRQHPRPTRRSLVPVAPGSAPDGARLERFPTEWNHSVDKKSLQNQNAGANSHRKSLSTFSEFALADHFIYIWNQSHNAFFAWIQARQSIVIQSAMIR